MPWRVIDFYTQNYPHSALAKLLTHSFQWETHTRDSGELHPWSTWPTMHRGVTNDQHHIRFLNQNLNNAKDYPPLWDLLLEQGKKVGLFGPLQSYPVNSHPLMCFHLPDTFSPEATSFPPHLSAFQALNLKATQSNKGINRDIKLAGNIKHLCAILTQLSYKTITKIVHHLYLEKRNPKMRSRRALMQPLLSFDLFMQSLNKNKPDFATFFSNHVAGIMHRYWRDSFPKDFNTSPEETDPLHRFSIIKAMHIFDQQLNQLLSWSKKHGYDLVIASSMGQEAIDRGECVYEIMIEDTQALLKYLQLDWLCQEKPSMYPDFVLEAYDATQCDSIIERCLSLKLNSGESLFSLKYSPTHTAINLSIGHTNSPKSTCQLGSEIVDFQTLGLKPVMRDQGTGYHQPYGSLIWHPHKSPTCTLAQRTMIDSCQFAPSILTALGVITPDYMMPALKEVTNA